MIFNYYQMLNSEISIPHYGFFSSVLLLFSDVYLAMISKMLFLWFHLLLWVCFVFISYKSNQVKFLYLDNNKWKIDGSKYQEIKKESKRKTTYKYWEQNGRHNQTLYKNKFCFNTKNKTSYNCLLGYFQILMFNQCAFLNEHLT